MIGIQPQIEKFLIILLAIDPIISEVNIKNTVAPPNNVRFNAIDTM